MIRSVLSIGLFFWGSSAVFGQAAATSPAFEVASIKPAAPQPEGMFRIGLGGDAGRITYTGVPLKVVLTRAYGVKQHQISGPSWLDSERFDITAKIPEGVSRDQVPVMLQNLLAERFKMVIRRETKEQPVYAMTVGKNGHKLTKASEDDSAGPVFAGGPNGGDVSVRRPPEGAVGAGRGGPGGGRAMMMIGANGGIQARRATVAGFCDMLSNILDRPVVDMTEIKGEYDITLEISPEEMRGMRMLRAGVAAAGGPGPGPGAGPAPDSTPGASIFTAVQQLGLKLDARKAPIEFIVVEKAEKVPTEN